jgi:aspartyl-tRNA(Asn)/glutamyl-tRNA(Gln) amidotransferase subunit A
VELIKQPIVTLARMLRQRQVSSVELTQAYLKRIKETEPQINAIITQAPDPLSCAKIADDAFSKPAHVPLSSLAGIGYMLKDNICTKGIKTTCASKMLAEFIPPYDATVTEKLKDTMGVLLAKTNLDEFAMGGSNENSAFGPVKNPLDPTKVPGGSSGGSAASVAAGMCSYALGSDTGGSIRQPAAYCGLVGLKPTYGAVSRYGLVAFASSLDQIGPITNTVEDSACVFHAISGKDQKDSTSSAHKYPDFETFLHDIKSPTLPLRFGVVTDFIEHPGVQKEIADQITDLVQQLSAKGFSCKTTPLSMVDDAISIYYLLSSAEASSNLARFDGVKYGYRADAQTLSDVYIKSRTEGFGPEVKRRIMLGTYALSSGYYDAYYHKALEARTAMRNHYQQALSACDVLIMPTTPTTAFNLGEKTHDPLKMYLMDIFTVGANITGLPAISIPCGLDKSGMPIGVSLVARAHDEITLLNAAYQIEQLLQRGVSSVNLTEKDTLTQKGGR